MPPRTGDWILTPRFDRGQELVYRGSFSEEASGLRVQFQRAYRIETRFFVLDTPTRGVELAALTILNHRNSTASAGPGTAAKPARGGIQIEPVSASVRLNGSSWTLMGRSPPPRDSRFPFLWTAHPRSKWVHSSRCLAADSSSTRPGK